MQFYRFKANKCVGYLPTDTAFHSFKKLNFTGRIPNTDPDPAWRFESGSATLFKFLQACADPCPFLTLIHNFIINMPHNVLL